MAEGAVSQIKDVPHTIINMPILALGIGLVFMVIVLLIESFKPGLFTDPIRKALSFVGIKTASA